MESFSAAYDCENGIVFKVYQMSEGKNQYAHTTIK